MKIVSDGTIHGTKVYDDDGKELSNITSVQWSISIDDEPRAVIEVLLPDLGVDINGDIQRERITVEARAVAEVESS